MTALSSERPLYLISKDGQLLVGTVSLADGRVEIQSAEAGKVVTLTIDFTVGYRVHLGATSLRAAGLISVETQRAGEGSGAPMSRVRHCIRVSNVHDQ